MSLLGCPIDCRPAIFVSGVNIAASIDERLNSLSSAPDGCQEEGGYSIIVSCILVTSSVSKTIWSWRAVTVVIPVIHSIRVCTQQLLLIGCCSSVWLEREESVLFWRSSCLVELVSYASPLPLCCYISQLENDSSLCRWIVCAKDTGMLYLEAGNNGCSFALSKTFYILLE